MNSNPLPEIKISSVVSTNSSNIINSSNPQSNVLNSISPKEKDSEKEQKKLEKLKKLEEKKNQKIEELKKQKQKEEEEKKKKIKKIQKSVIPKLQKSCIDLSILRNSTFKQLKRILETISGKKKIVIDPSLVGAFSLVVPMSFLKNQGVNKKIGIIEEKTFKTDCRTLIFFTHPRINLIKFIVNEVEFLVENAKNEKKKPPLIHLYFVPRKNLLCEYFLSNSSVFNYFQKPFKEFSSFDLIPVDNNLISMEIPFSFKEYEIEGDHSSLFFLSRSVVKIESIFGLIPRLKFIGNASKNVTNQILNLKQKIELNFQLNEKKNFLKNFLNSAPEISEAIFIDRSVDLISPLVTGLTYESLVDEFYEIKENCLDLGFFKRNEEKLMLKNLEVGKKKIESIEIENWQKILNEKRKIENEKMKYYDSDKKKKILEERRQKDLKEFEKLKKEIEKKKIEYEEKFLEEKEKEKEKEEKKNEKKDEKKDEKKTEKVTKIALNDDDKIFLSIRHSNFGGVGEKLKQETFAIEGLYDERKNLKEINDIKNFFYKIPEISQRHEDLVLHIRIAQEIKEETLKSEFKKKIEMEQNIISELSDDACFDYIENLIIKQESLLKVLRLMCLMSVIKNGFSKKNYDQLKKELVHSYGHFVLLTLANLEKAGLFKKYESRSSFSSLRSSLNLMEENIDEKNPKSISYVHSGYAPLTIRIIEHKNQWESIKKLFKNLPVGEEIQTELEPQTKLKVVLVVFIGGCTFCEISALRFLEKTIPNVCFLILTTKIINGNTFIGNLIEMPF